MHSTTWPPSLLLALPQESSAWTASWASLPPFKSTLQTHLWNSTLQAHPRNLPFKPSLKTYPSNPPFKPTLPPHPWNSILQAHPWNLPFKLSLETYHSNPPFKHSLQTHPSNPLRPTLQTHPSNPSWIPARQHRWATSLHKLTLSMRFTFFGKPEKIPFDNHLRNSFRLQPYYGGLTGSTTKFPEKIPFDKPGKIPFDCSDPEKNPFD